MYKFTGTLKNEFYAEEGVNITVKGVEDDRIILAPNGPWYDLNKEQKDSALKFTLTASSGNTEEPRKVGVEVTNGSEKVTTKPTHWEVEITGSSDSEPVGVQLTIFEVEPEPEE
jgi:hypothetical protein